MPLPLRALAMCAFCIGTAGFVVMRLLPDVARDLGVSIPLAGQVVTATALGVTVRSPRLAYALCMHCAWVVYEIFPPSHDIPRGNSN